MEAEEREKCNIMVVDTFFGSSTRHIFKAAGLGIN